MNAAICPDVEVSILSVSGDKVRIGLAAPRETAVFRTEVYEAIEAGNPPAEPGPPPD